MLQEGNTALFNPFVSKVSKSTFSLQVKPVKSHVFASVNIIIGYFKVQPANVSCTGKEMHLPWPSW